MGARDRAEPPLVERAVLHLYDAVAGRADEVVVVLVAAEAVAHLRGAVGQGMDHMALAQEPERPVDGREADRLATATQSCVDLLGGGVVTLAGEDVQNPEALPRRPKPVAGEEGPEVGSGGAGHTATIRT